MRLSGPLSRYIIALAALTHSARGFTNTTEHEKRAPTWSFPYGSTKVRGVNLGGWLVLEPWITPSLFDGTGDSRIIDEYTFGQYQDYNTAHAKLVNHWNTWVTEADFQAIKNAGLNHIRLPIGYWAWDVSRGEPYHQGQLPYLYTAIGWARNTGLKIIIDLHGAPGSQNGYDNSGQKVSYPQWHTSNDNIARTNAIIKNIASTFSSYSDVVAAIAPLNEPAGYFGSDVLAVTRQYWYDSYGNIRYPYGTATQGPLLEVIHNAFQDLSYWSGFMPSSSFEGVMMDVHEYQVFSDAELDRSWDQHIQFACSRRSAYANFHLWTVVGEWSLAATDCARYLNGRGIGARWDATYPGARYHGACAPYTGSGAGFSNDYKTFLRRFWEAQVTAWEAGEGWIYWTWKAENADDWSYQNGLRYGWIPQDPNQRLYPGICG